MISNMNDGTAAAPYLRLDISDGNLELPASSSLPADLRSRYAAIRSAGFRGIQGGDPALCAEFQLRRTGSFRVNKPEEAEEQTRRSRDTGEECATLHVGWGMESDVEIYLLIDAILNASAKHNHPLYVETHRATVTQDLYRAVELTKRHPGIRFNGDFSHWYTGLEMVYGSLNEKQAFIAPVLERVRFLHGRIGNPGCIQVHIGDTMEEALSRSYVQHFMQLWIDSMRGFLRAAQPGDFLIFAPELLPSRIFYARTLPDGREESDRWRQAQLLAQIALRCFAEAHKPL